jgi:hypothetical protein
LARSDVRQQIELMTIFADQAANRDTTGPAQSHKQGQQIYGTRHHYRRCAAQEGACDCVTKAVADTGIGMTSEQMDKLFRNSPKLMHRRLGNMGEQASSSRSAIG